MAAATHTFGFIGLGNMGSQMAHNLTVYAKSKSLPPVHVWNRSRGKSEQFAKQNVAKVADSVESLVQTCDVIHMCLANDEVALSIVRQILAVGKQELILVDHSTLFPTTSKLLQEEANSHQVAFCSCPVFGPPAAAKTAGLLITLSGAENALEVLREYIVPTLGKAVIDCGEDTSRGALLKILGNNCILGTIELLSESFTLAEKTGFDVALFYEFIQAWFPAAAWVNYGKKVRDGSFSGGTGFTLSGGMKDAAYIRRLGAETSTPTPIIDQAWNHMTAAKAIGGESLDWSACAAGMRLTAGLPPFKGEDFTLQKNGANGNQTNGGTQKKE
ncbi:nad -binding [Trichoderma arundinaceum]|uniref:Nad-binding n=1 Tax=Trichoderma arundinaceum TaxID=490622 RepID=A0A395NBF6_TRIAR|nr:nad -binding [Trichoderma arundinaceum]